MHGIAIQAPIGLRARSSHRWAFGSIEDPELNAGRIGDAAHETVERVDLTDQMALAQTADGWVAGHHADCRPTLRQQRGSRTASRGRGRRLATSMAAADNHDVKEFRVEHIANMPDRDRCAKRPRSGRSERTERFT